MNIIKLNRDFLKNKLDLPYNALEENIIDTSRWSIHYEIIFEYDNKFYKTYYSQGATECQDESPWEYEEEVECTEVHKVPKIIEAWEPIE